MNFYEVIRKSDGEKIYGYLADSPVEWAGMEFDQFDHVDAIHPLPDETIPARKYGGRRTLTKLEFVELLGDAAYIAILALARQSVEVESFVKKLEMATPDRDTGYSVNLDDPRLSEGINTIGMQLEANGIVDLGWSQEVLNG